MAVRDKWFYVAPYDNGFPVIQRSGYFTVAVFVTQDEAQNYADYRNAMLLKYNTTDVLAYRLAVHEYTKGNPLGGQATNPNELPWDERVTMLQINPDAATRDDIARMATELSGYLEYIKGNPLGGPATLFDTIANRIRAGEDYYFVLNDYGLRFDDAKT